MLIVTETIVRYVEFIEPSCMFSKSELYDMYSFSEKHEICKEYNSIEFDNTQPFSLLKSDQMGKYVNINSNGFRGSEINANDNILEIL